MKNIKEMIEYPREGILSKEICKDDKLDLGLFCMAAGTVMGDHTSVKTAFVQVVEGDGVFNLEGKDIVMKPGVVILMKAGAVHNLKAIENTAFILGLY
ncbi:cupin domain-containing protein [archaeon]|jgi:nitric oxide dioxygenase|nr:cupin domain-containing protein [archaeon]MBT7128252.1 cupin domain-containing protein [archaeon]